MTDEDFFRAAFVSALLPDYITNYVKIWKVQGNEGWPVWLTESGVEALESAYRRIQELGEYQVDGEIGIEGTGRD